MAPHIMAPYVWPRMIWRNNIWWRHVYGATYMALYIYIYIYILCHTIWHHINPFVKKCSVDAAATLSVAVAVEKCAAICEHVAASSSVQGPVSPELTL